MVWVYSLLRKESMAGSKCQLMNKDKLSSTILLKEGLLFEQYHNQEFDCFIPTSRKLLCLKYLAQTIKAHRELSLDKRSQPHLAKKAQLTSPILLMSRPLIDLGVHIES